MPGKKDYSYNDLEHFCTILATSIRTHALPTFDALLAVAPDGLFPAQLVSHFLEVPIVWIVGVERDPETLLYVPNPLLLTGLNVLVIDLWVKTGRRFAMVREFLTQGLMEHGQVQLKTATVVAPFALVGTGEMPDFFGGIFWGDEQPSFPWSKH